MGQGNHCLNSYVGPSGWHHALQKPKDGPGLWFSIAMLSLLWWKSEEFWPDSGRPGQTSELSSEKLGLL